MFIPTQAGQMSMTPAQARATHATQASQASNAANSSQAINGTSLPGQVAGGHWFDGPDWRGFLWRPDYTIGHSGNDIGMPLGTPLTALLPGRVISLGMEPWGGQINLQSTYPGIGPIVISYLHESSFARGMAAGVAVEPGDVIGYSGQPPPGGKYGSGAHCHFEVNTGHQPPYMGHQGPPSPIDSLFLIQAARNGTLGEPGSVPPGLDQLDSTTSPSGLVNIDLGNFASWFGLPSFSLGTGAVTRAPLSPGFLGVVESLDQNMELVPFNSDNVLGWASTDLQALGIRATIMVMGVIIILVCIFNVMKPIIEQEAQLAGPLLQAAATGAL